jgi:hypothetical protein
MTHPIYSSLPWIPDSDAGDTSPGVDVQFFHYPLYGGRSEEMRAAYPNYPTAFVNLGGFPYTDKAMYGGFLSGFINENEKG